MRQKLIDQIENYQPFNEQEKADKAVILEYLYNVENVFERTELTAHITASAWVVNREHTKVLMAYHNIYKSWSWLGGHADGSTDLLSVAMREVREESGVTDVRPLSDEIFSIEVLTVDGHEKRGKYVPSHLHLNITYLLEADEAQQTCVKPDENSDVAWFSPDEAVQRSTEPWFRERIYSKLNEKLAAL